MRIQTADRSYRLSGRYRLSAIDDNLGRFARFDRDRGAVGHNAQRRLHAIQTLSQLSYSPTVSCSIRVACCTKRESSTVETAEPTDRSLATALGETITAAKRTARRGQASPAGPSFSGHARAPFVGHLPHKAATRGSGVRPLRSPSTPRPQHAARAMSPPPRTARSGHPGGEDGFASSPSPAVDRHRGRLNRAC